MPCDFILLHYYAFFARTTQFQALFANFMKMKKDVLKKDYPTIYSIDDSSYLIPCLVHGCTNSFEFAAYLYNAMKKGEINVIDISHRVIQSISNRFVMSNVVDEVLIEQKAPFLIWYPSTPSKETCLELLEKFPDKTNYQLAVVAILNDWTDLYLKAKVKSEYHLFSLAKLLNRTEIYAHQQEIEPIPGQHYVIILCQVQKSFPNQTIITSGTLSTVLERLMERPFAPDSSKIYQERELNIEGHDCCFASVEPQQFEHSFLSVLLDGRPKGVEGYDLALGEEEGEVGVKRILTDSEYALRVFHAYPERFGKYCVERFVSVGYLNRKLIDQFAPFTWSREYSGYYLGYSDMLEKYGNYEYNIILASVKSHANGLYFKRNVDPEPEVFKVAALCGNLEVYYDQLSKAKKLGKFFRHLDPEKRCSIYPPQEVPIDGVELIEPGFSYEFYTSTNPSQISLSSKECKGLDVVSKDVYYDALERSSIASTDGSVVCSTNEAIASSSFRCKKEGFFMWLLRSLFKRYVKKANRRRLEKEAVASSSKN